jgi:thiol:disulfide interchange protein
MSKKSLRKPSRLPQFLIIGGVVLLVLLFLLLKDRSPAEVPASAGALPQAQLEDALRAGKPALAFFHSNNCKQCIIMIETVEQVFPEFDSTVVLVDINVYDPNNEPFLQQIGLQYIPTLMFYDQYGQEQTYVGVMEADVLRQRLSSLAGAQ